jgi:hypothetical protein
VAFQGDIAQLSFSAGSISSSSKTAGCFWLETASAFAQAEADIILRYILIPTWRDGLPHDWLNQGFAQLNSAMYWNVHMLDADATTAAVYLRGVNAGSATWLNATVNGATYTANHPAQRSQLPPNFRPLPAGGI